MGDKTRKMRGLRTFGKSKKGNRGGGSRGGRGRAGFHKHKYIHLLKYEPDAYGRKGFKSKRPGYVKAINLVDLPEGGVVDLRELGYTKLLGRGNVEREVTIVVNECSVGARKKVESAGGKVVSGIDG